MPVSGREWSQFACAEVTFGLVLWNTPILNHFQRVGRALVSGVARARNIARRSLISGLAVIRDQNWYIQCRWQVAIAFDITLRGDMDCTCGGL